MNRAASIRVLLVDDEVETTLSLLRKLEVRGLSATQVMNAEEFFVSFAADKPDFVVVDMQLPMQAGGQIKTNAGEAILEFLTTENNPKNRTFVLSYDIGRIQAASAAQEDQYFSKGNISMLVERIADLSQKLGPYRENKA